MSPLERICAVAVGAVAAAQVLGHRYLPMNDVPSHMATAVIAQALQRGDPFFSEYYVLPLTPVPYWMTTLGMLLLMPALDAHRAFAVLVAAYVLLVPLSFWILTRALGHAGGLLTAVAGLTALNRWHWKGETNFLLGQPLVLLAFAALVRARQGRRSGLASYAVLAALIYLCHLYPLTALLVATGCVLGADLLARRPARASLFCFLWTLLLFSIAARFVLQSDPGLPGARPEFGLSLSKLAGLAVGPFESPTFGALPWVLPFVGALLLLVVGPTLRARPRPLASEAVDPTALFPAGVLLALSALGPGGIVASSGVREGEVAERFILPGFLLLLASIRRPPSPRPAALVLVSVFAVLKLVDARALHERLDDDVKEISASLLAKVPPQQRLLCIRDVGQADPIRDLYHRVGLYGVVERGAYSPHVFAVPGQQPLRHRRAPHRPRLSDRDVSPEEWAFYDYLLVQTDRLHPEIAGLETHGRELARWQNFRLYGLETPGRASDLAGDRIGAGATP